MTEINACTYIYICCSGKNPRGKKEEKDESSTKNVTLFARRALKKHRFDSFFE